MTIAKIDGGGWGVHRARLRLSRYDMISLLCFVVDRCLGCTGALGLRGCVRRISAHVLCGYCMIIWWFSAEEEEKSSKARQRVRVK